MSSVRIAWRAGDPKLTAQIEEAFARALEEPEPIHASGRRTLHRLSLAKSDAKVVLKIYHRRPGLRAIRDSFKRGLAVSAAQREWLALERTTASGIPVPRPLARGQLSDHPLFQGDEIIVMEYVPGISLLEALPDFEADAWEATCRSLAGAIRRLHEAGLRHGDLHPGNLLLAESGIVLLDLQSTRRLRGASDRLTDLARLEFSLRRSGASPRMCLSLRAALGVGCELEDAILLFTRDFQRGRARRHLRVGGRWQRLIRSRTSRGLLAQGLDPELALELCHAIAVDDPNIRLIRQTTRTRVYELSGADGPIIRKEISAGGWARAIADRFRGSSGSRAFRRGQADRLISDRSAPVLAYLDLTRHGLPGESWLFMDKVGDEDLDHFEPHDSKDALRVALALGSWLAESHATGLSHRDLKGGNIRIRVTPSSVRFWLVDLQDLTGPAFVPESARIEALSQINASLADETFDQRTRIAALEAYAARLPFSRPLETITAEIVRRSLARHHRWHATACATTTQD